MSCDSNFDRCISILAPLIPPQLSSSHMSRGGELYRSVPGGGEHASQPLTVVFALLINYIYESGNYLITSPLQLPQDSSRPYNFIQITQEPLPIVSTVNVIVTRLSRSNVVCIVTVISAIIRRLLK